MGEMEPFLINYKFFRYLIPYVKKLALEKSMMVRKYSHAGNGMFPHWEHDVPTMGISASRRAGLESAERKSP